jgi:hypothetical protein
MLYDLGSDISANKLQQPCLYALIVMLMKLHFSVPAFWVTSFGSAHYCTYAAS